MVFDKYTKKKESNCGYRLLLVDKYCSHINIKFFNYEDKHQIIIVVLLSYATY